MSRYRGGTTVGGIRPEGGRWSVHIHMNEPKRKTQRLLLPAPRLAVASWAVVWTCFQCGDSREECEPEPRGMAVPFWLKSLPWALARTREGAETRDVPGTKTQSPPFSLLLGASQGQTSEAQVYPHSDRLGFTCPAGAGRTWGAPRSPLATWENGVPFRFLPSGEDRTDILTFRHTDSSHTAFVRERKHVSAPAPFRDPRPRRHRTNSPQGRVSPLGQ